MILIFIFFSCDNHRKLEGTAKILHAVPLPEGNHCRHLDARPPGLFNGHLCILKIILPCTFFLHLIMKYKHSLVSKGFVNVLIILYDREIFVGCSLA